MNPGQVRAAVVVGVDDAGSAGDAVDWAAAEAATRGCRLRIVHAFHPLLPADPYGVGSPIDGLRAAQTMAESVVQRHAARASPAGHEPYERHFRTALSNESAARTGCRSTFPPIRHLSLQAVDECATSAALPVVALTSSSPLDSVIVPPVTKSFLPAASDSHHVIPLRRKRRR
jgi:Universal stress protein family